MALWDYTKALDCVPKSTLSEPCAYTVRVAVPTDLSALATVLLSSFYPPSQLNRCFYPLLRVGLQEDLKLRLTVHSSTYCCLAAVDGQNQVVGTAEVSIRPQWLPWRSPRAYVSNLAVRRQERRRGIAQQLLASCEAIAHQWGQQQLYLHVDCGNDQAQRLYAKLGYATAPTSEWLDPLTQLGWQRRRQLLVKELG